MGIRVQVYRGAGSHGDCSLNGISKRFDMLTVINAEGPFEPDAEAPAVLLHCHYNKCLRIVAATKDGKPAGQPMFGGNYAACSDSRFSELATKLTGIPFYGAVAIHDRYEPGFGSAEA